MRFSAGRLLSLVLLSLYGSISLLGHGLHELSSVDHHHGPATSHAADAGHHHHNHGTCSGHHHHAPAPAGDGVSHDHECEVCVFLAQILSEPPQLTTVVRGERFVAEAVVFAPRLASQTAEGLHAPRGPPAFVG